MTDNQTSIYQYVYVLSNESIPGMYKVGMTTSSPEQRMDQLYTTGVPTPFKLEVSIAVIEARDSERLAHKALADYRVSGRREFFKGDMDEIVAAILSAIDLYRIEYVRKPELLADVNNEFAKQADKKVAFRERLENKCIELRTALARIERRCETLLKVRNHFEETGIPEAGWCCFDTLPDGSEEQNGPGFVMLAIRSAPDSLKRAITEIETAMQDQEALDRIYERKPIPEFLYELGLEKRNYESDFREQILLMVKDTTKRRNIREMLDKFNIHTASGEDPKFSEFRGHYVQGSIR